MDSDSDAVNDLLSEIDPELIAITLTLSSSQRVERWLHAREIAVAFRLARLRKLYPDLSPAELNLKMIESFDA